MYTPIYIKSSAAAGKLGLTNWSNERGRRMQEEEDLKVCKNQYYYAVFQLFSAIKLSLGSRVVVPVMMVPEAADDDDQRTGRRRNLLAMHEICTLWRSILYTL